MNVVSAAAAEADKAVITKEETNDVFRTYISEKREKRQKKSLAFPARDVGS